MKITISVAKTKKKTENETRTIRNEWTEISYVCTVWYGMLYYKEVYVIILYQIKSRFNSIQFNLTILTYVSSIWFIVVLFNLI